MAVTGTPFMPSVPEPEDPDTPVLHADTTDPVEETQCPECRGRCFDKHDEPCLVCLGEGVIDWEEPPAK